MIVKYKQIERDSGRYGTVYEVESIVACCDEFTEAWENRSGVGPFRFGEGGSLNTENAMKILQTFAYPEGTHYDGYEITYCPFCGSKVTYERITHVKQVKEEQTKEKTVTRTKEVEIE